MGIGVPTNSRRSAGHDCGKHLDARGLPDQQIADRMDLGLLDFLADVPEGGQRVTQLDAALLARGRRHNLLQLRHRDR